MTQRIVIEGDIARYEEVSIYAETPLADLMPHLQTRLPTVFPIVPDNARVMGFNPQTHSGGVMIELPPARRRIRADLRHYNALQTDQDHNLDDEGYAQFDLAFPYMIFAFGFTFHERDGSLVDFGINSWRLFYRPSRITSMDDPLWTARLMNVDEIGGICWGGTRAESRDLSLRIDEMVKSFSRTIFNPDLQQRRPGGYRSYTAWERASDNPLVFTGWPEWQTPPRGQTVKSILESIMGGNLPVADLSAYTDAIPEPPNVFSVARARQWFDQLDEPHQRRFLFALQQRLAGVEAPPPLTGDEDDTPNVAVLEEPTQRGARRAAR